MAKYVYERWDYFYEVEPADPKASNFPSKLRRVLKNGDLEESITTSPEPMSAYYINGSSASYIDSYNSGSPVFIYTGERGIGTSYIYHQAKSKNDIINTIRPTVLIEEFIAEEGTYPDNGIQGDYWYIKTRKAFPDIHVKVNGELRKVQSAWVKVGGHTTPVLPEGQKEYIAYANSPDGVEGFVSMGWGENILMDSGVETTNNLYAVKTYSWGDTNKVVAGEYYTVTVEGRLHAEGEGQDGWYLNVYTENPSGHPQAIILLKEHKVSEDKWVGTFKMPTPPQGGSYRGLSSLYPWPLTHDGLGATVRRIKLEKGSTATPWQPHSSEVQDRHFVGLYQGLDSDSLRDEGENLLLSSGVSITNSEYVTQTYTMSQRMVSGQTYTLQIWGQLGEGKTGFQSYLNSGNGFNFLVGIKKVSEGYYAATFQGKEGVDYTEDKLLIYSLPNTLVVDSTIDKIKLELGPTATPWSPAPADILEAINNPSSYTWMSKSMYHGVLKEVKDIYVKKDGHLKKGI